MEESALRAVPARLPGPANPVRALAQVEALLPGLSAQSQRALALVDLGALPRAEAAGQLGVTEADLSGLVAGGRKALRRTLEQLPSGGWCERAERLISDRLDDALTGSGHARLNAHLAGCERCATHERRLVQAHDLLVESYLTAHPPAPSAVATAAAPSAELRAVDEAAATTARTLPASLAWRVVLALALLLIVALVALAAAGVLHVG